MKTKLFCLAGIATVLTILLPLKTYAEKNKTVFVLFDLSESTSQYDTRKEYFEIFKRIVDLKDVRGVIKDSFVQPGDVLVADIISDNSISGSTFPILMEFRRFSNWSDNRFLYGNRMKKEKEEILRKAQEILFDTRRKIMLTDILSSLHIAERVFKRFNKGTNFLIIMSDMKEESREYDFARERINDKRINEIITKERGRGLPDLKGVKVYVAGARADDRNSFGGIQRFWLRYFRECGATIEEKNYGRGFIGVND